MTGRGSFLEVAAHRAGPLADAVLHEGQVLFPYRASALKNRYRWQWGVLAPPRWPGAVGSDRPDRQVEVLADVRAGAALAGRVRFVRLRTRTLEPAPAPGAGEPATAPWDEALAHHVDLGPVPVPEPGTTATETVSIDLPAAATTTADEHGQLVGRRQEHVEGEATLEVERIDGPWSLVRARVTIRNRTAWRDDRAPRPEALRRSLVGVHVVLAVHDGAFVSSVDPPEFAAAAVSGCRSDGLWPAVLGPVGDTDVVLAAPIILPDQATVAGRSPGDSCDATEIDELLALSVAALGEDEQREALATDPMAASIVDRAATAGPAATLALHASARPVPTARLDGEPLVRGMRVRLRPQPGTDAQDLFVTGRVGIVETVLEDVDGVTHVAVTIEDDPGADLHRLHGRYRYFRLGELERLGARP